MRKVFTALLALMILLCLPGCLNPQEPPQVALCMAQRPQGIAAESVACLEEALLAAGMQVQILHAGNDQRKQLEQLQLLDQQIDLVILEPVMASASAEIAESLHTGAIFLHRQPEASVLNQKQFCFVGPDPAQPGSLQPQLLQQLPDQGDVNGDGSISYLFLGGPEADVDTQLRLTAIQETVAPEDKILTCLEVCYGQWDRESGNQKLKQQLAKYGKDIEVVFCANDDIAIGALEAVKDGGRTVGRDIYLLGIDGQQHAQVLIRSGELSGTVALDLQAMAQTVTEVAQKLLAGKTVEDCYTVPYLLLNKENIDAYMDSDKG